MEKLETRELSKFENSISINLISIENYNFSMAVMGFLKEHNINKIVEAKSMDISTLIKEKKVSIKLARKIISEIEAL